MRQPSRPHRGAGCLPERLQRAPLASRTARRGCQRPRACAHWPPRPRPHAGPACTACPLGTGGGVGLVCEPCSPGTAGGGFMDQGCAVCNATAASYSSGTGAPACSTCPAGYIASDDRTQCGARAARAGTGRPPAPTLACAEGQARGGPPAPPPPGGALWVTACAADAATKARAAAQTGPAPLRLCGPPSVRPRSTARSVPAWLGRLWGCHQQVPEVPRGHIRPKPYRLPALHPLRPRRDGPRCWGQRVPRVLGRRRGERYQDHMWYGARGARVNLRV
jgi:hypothetical protein